MDASSTVECRGKCGGGNGRPIHDPVHARLPKRHDFRRDLRALEAIHQEEKALLRGLMEIRSIEYE